MMSSSRSLSPVAVLLLTACNHDVAPAASSSDGSTTQAPAPTSTDASTGGSSSSTAAADESSSGGVSSQWCLSVQDPPFPGTNGAPLHGDVDGDGRPELWLRPLVDGEIHWQALTQAPDGTFALTAGGTTFDFNARHIGDVDGDGHDDLIITRDSFPRDTVWRAGMPDRTFDVAEHPLPDTEGVFGELDGDGRVDRIVEAESAGPSQFRLELGLGNGDFMALASTIDPGAPPVMLGSAGVPSQFVVVGRDAVDFSSFIIRVFRFDASFALTPMAVIGLGATEPWAVTDVDGDGLVDVVLEKLPTLERRLYLARGQANGTLTPELLDTISTREGTVGDFDGDGLHDLLWWNASDDQVWLRLGVPGGFGDMLPVQGAERLEVHQTVDRAVDYDGDGRATWVTHHGSELLAIELETCPR